MNRSFALYGASLLVVAVLLPVLFFLYSLIDVALIRGLLLGLDWFCCFGLSVILLLAGLFLLLVGIRTD